MARAAAPNPTKIVFACTHSPELFPATEAVVGVDAMPTLEPEELPASATSEAAEGATVEGASVAGLEGLLIVNMLV